MRSIIILAVLIGAGMFNNHLNQQLSLQLHTPSLVKTARANDMSCNMCNTMYPFIDFQNNNALSWHEKQYACAEENIQRFAFNIAGCIFHADKPEACGMWDVNYDDKVDAGDISAFVFCCGCPDAPTPTPSTILIPLNISTENSPPNAIGSVRLENLHEDQNNNQTTFTLKGTFNNLEPFEEYRVWILRDGTQYNPAGSLPITADQFGNSVFNAGTVIFPGEMREIGRAGIWKSSQIHQQDDPYPCRDVFTDVSCVEGVRQ